MPPVPNSNFLAARASTSSEAAPLELPGSPAIAAVLISISIIVLAATLLILYRLWRFRSRRRARADVDEFDMPEMTRKLHGSDINETGITPFSGVIFAQVVDVHQTRPSMRTPAPTRTPDNVEQSRFSVIDISPAALRSGLARHSTTPFLSTTTISLNSTLMHIDGPSNYHPSISHHTITQNSLAPSITSIVDKPLPRRPSEAGSSYLLRAQQLSEMPTHPERFSYGGSSSTGSSLSRSRPESEASLFSFIQHRASSIRAEDDIQRPAPIHIPTAAAAGYAGHSFSGQVVAGNKLHDDDQISATHQHNTDFIDPWIHSSQDARQTLPPPWFERVASTSRAHQPTTNTPSRISHHRLAIRIPEPLQTTRRYSYHHLYRPDSTATTLMTPPPPPYTPLDINCEVPPLPQNALLRKSQRLVLVTNSPPDNPTLGRPSTQHLPAFTPCTNDSKAALRSQFNQQQARSNNHGTVTFTRPRSNSLPIQNISLLPGPISTRRQSRAGTSRPLLINTGAGMTGRAWFPGTIDEIVSTTPSRGTFTIDE